MLTLPRKLWALLTSRERWQLAGLSGMVMLTGLAQVVGVGSIAPFVSVLAVCSILIFFFWKHAWFWLVALVMVLTPILGMSAFSGLLEVVFLTDRLLNIVSRPPDAPVRANYR